MSGLVVNSLGTLAEAICREHDPISWRDGKPTCADCMNLATTLVMEHVSALPDALRRLAEDVVPDLFPKGRDRIALAVGLVTLAHHLEQQ